MNFSGRSLSMLSTTIAAISGVLAFPFLPKRVAMHFNLDGEPDRYGSRGSAAIMVPAIMAGIELANERVGSWPGGDDREDTASGREARDQAIGLAELALLWAHLIVLAKGLGARINTERWNRAVFGALMVSLGNVMPKVPRNGLVGIRTPWTLADPGVWERTHRVAGYLMTAAGVLMLVSLPSSNKQLRRLPVVAVVLSVAYSLVAYIRRPSAGA